MQSNNYNIRISQRTAQTNFEKLNVNKGTFRRFNFHIFNDDAPEVKELGEKINTVRSDGDIFESSQDMEGHIQYQREQYYILRYLQEKKKRLGLSMYGKTTLTRLEENFHIEADDSKLDINRHEATRQYLKNVNITYMNKFKEEFVNFFVVMYNGEKINDSPANQDTFWMHVEVMQMMQILNWIQFIFPGHESVNTNVWLIEIASQLETGYTLTVNAQQPAESKELLFSKNQLSKLGVHKLTTDNAKKIKGSNLRAMVEHSGENLIPENQDLLSFTGELFTIFSFLSTKKEQDRSFHRIHKDH
jgi:hypothetical protein